MDALITTQPDNDYASNADGRRLITAQMCRYPPAVNPDDLLRVNFDVKKYRHEGLYLLEEAKDDRIVWRGCRRFQRNMVTGELQLDQSGEGDWFNVADMSKFPWRIVGLVETVYKPTRVG